MKAKEGYTNITIIPDKITKRKPFECCATCGSTIAWKVNPKFIDFGSVKLLPFCDQTCCDNYQSKSKRIRK